MARSFGSPVLLMLAVLCSASAVTAQRGPTCDLPAEQQSLLKAHSTADAYDAMGAYFAQRGLDACSISAFEESLRLRPDAWQGHYDLAMELVSSGNAKRGYEEMLIASRLNPELPQIDLGLGLALIGLQRPEEALNKFRAILKTDPSSVSAFDGVARALMGEKRYTAAIYSLQNAPADRAIQLDRAMAYSGNGDLERAAQILVGLVQEKPADATAHANLGFIYAQQRQYHQASLELEESLRLNATNEVVQAAYIKSLIDAEQYATALPVSQRYLRSKPHDFEVVEQAGEVERGVGDYAAAETLLQEAVAIRPDDYNARYFLGCVLAALGNATEARIQLQRAVELSPGSTEARYQLAQALRSLGHLDQAREELKILQQKKEDAYKKDIAVSKSTQANRFLQAGETLKAIAMYRESIAQDASNPRTYYDLALALHRNGDIGGERQALARSVEISADFAPAHNQLGFIFMQSGSFAEAESEFKMAISLDPQYAEAQNNLGVLYARLGNTGQAEQLLRESTENDPQYADAYVNLGLVLASESRFLEAEQALKHGTELSASNAVGLSALAMVSKHLKGP